MQMLRLCLCSEFFAKFARVCGNSWGCLCLISSFLCCRRRGFGRLLSFEWKENNFLSNPRASQKPAIPCYFPVINNPSQNLGRLIKRKEKKKKTLCLRIPTGWLLLTVSCLLIGEVSRAGLLSSPPLCTQAPSNQKAVVKGTTGTSLLPPL